MHLSELEHPVQPREMPTTYMFQHLNAHSRQSIRTDVSRILLLFRQRTLKYLSVDRL